MRVDGSFRRHRACQEAFRGLESLLAHTGRWATRAAPPDIEHVSARREQVVVVSVDVAHGPDDTFACLADPLRYSRWLGVPVSIVDGRFSCTTESGTRVRGAYEAVVPPSLIAMRWDFEDDDVPVPGNARAAYLRIAPTPEGCHVGVQQFVADDEEADAMQAVWVTVLGRLRAGMAEALDPGPTEAP